MSDESGFRPMAMSEYAEETNESSSIMTTIICSAITAASASATDNYIGNTALKPQSVSQANAALRDLGVNRASRRALTRNIPRELRDLELPVEGVAKFQKTVGVIGTALLGLVVYEDWKNNYSWKTRAKSIGVDALGFCVGIAVGGLIGLLNAPVLASAALVFGAGYFIGKGTTRLKEKLCVS